MSLSGKGRRNKGLVGEREVAHLFRNAGFEVKNLDGGGDHLVVIGVPLHLEIKRQETIKIEMWSRQAEAEAAEHCIPIVVYRRSNQPWRASLPLANLLQILQEATR